MAEAGDGDKPYTRYLVLLEHSRRAYRVPPPSVCARLRALCSNVRRLSTHNARLRLREQHGRRCAQLWWRGRCFGGDRAASRLRVARFRARLLQRWCSPSRRWRSSPLRSWPRCRRAMQWPRCRSCGPGALCASGALCEPAIAARRLALINQCASALWVNGIGALVLAHAPSLRMRSRTQMLSTPHNFDMFVCGLVGATICTIVLYGSLFLGPGEAVIDTVCVGAVVAVFRHSVRGLARGRCRIRLLLIMDTVRRVAGRGIGRRVRRPGAMLPVAHRRAFDVARVGETVCGGALEVAPA